jgi:ribulose-phosphate 3-epimerase
MDASSPTSPSACPVVKAIARTTQLPIDAHLMIVEPGRYADQFAKAGARMVSIHIEADPNAHRTLSSIKAAGALAGIVINPATSLSALDEVIKFADYVLVMSV